MTSTALSLKYDYFVDPFPEYLRRNVQSLSRTLFPISAQIEAIYEDLRCGPPVQPYVRIHRIVTQHKTSPIKSRALERLNGSPLFFIEFVDKLRLEVEGKDVPLIEYFIVD